MSKLNVLLVDDEPRVLRSLKAALKNEFNIFVVNCPEQAKDFFKNQSETIDVMVTDQKMPKLSGTELIKWVNTQSPNCKNVLLTGMPKVNDIKQQLKDNHYSACLSKPWDNQDLIEAIHAASKQEIQQTSKLNVKESNSSVHSLIFHNANDQTKQLSEEIHSEFTNISKMYLTNSETDLINKLDSDSSISGIIINYEDGDISDLIKSIKIYKLDTIILTPASFAMAYSNDALFKGTQVVVKPISLNRLKPLIQPMLNKR